MRMYDSHIIIETENIKLGRCYANINELQQYVPRIHLYYIEVPSMLREIHKNYYTEALLQSYLY